MFWFSGIAALLLIGAAGFFARDVLQRNVAKDIAAAPAGDTVVDFSAYQVGKDPVAARPYFNKYGISVDNMVPQDSEIVLINNRGLYEGGRVMPSASQIFLTQTGTNNVPASNALTFSKPVAHMSFTRPTLYAATSSGVTHPAWKATALGSNGEELASQSETLLRKMKDPGNDTVLARTVTLESVTFQGIAAVRFDSDPRLNGKPFAGFSTLLIERLTFRGTK
jgi:hypothetical protein